MLYEVITQVERRGRRRSVVAVEIDVAPQALRPGIVSLADEKIEIAVTVDVGKRGHADVANVDTGVFNGL